MNLHTLQRVVIGAWLVSILLVPNAGLLAQQYGRTVILSGLDNPHGLAWGPDGGLYVAEAGRGGDGPCIPSFTGDGSDVCFGSTSAVSRWKDGMHQRVVAGLPSVASQGGANASGLHDLLFTPDALIGLIGGVGSQANRESLGAGAENLGHVVSIALDGSGDVSPLADLMHFEGSTNPDGRLVESNPYALSGPAVSDGLPVVDAAGNSLLDVARDGTVSTLAVLPPRANPLPFGPPMFEAVPTAIAVDPDGDLHVGEFTGFPFPPGEANIYRYDDESGELEVAFAGFTNLIDLAFNDDGSLYALQLTTNGLAAADGPGSGVLWRIDPASGDRTMIASDGLMFPTAVLPGPDGSLYVSNFGTSASNGQVLRLAPVPEPCGIAMLLAAVLCVPYAYTFRRWPNRD